MGRGGLSGCRTLRLGRLPAGGGTDRGLPAASAPSARKTLKPACCLLPPQPAPARSKRTQQAPILRLSLSPDPQLHPSGAAKTPELRAPSAVIWHLSVFGCDKFPTLCRQSSLSRICVCDRQALRPRGRGGFLSRILQLELTRGCCASYRWPVSRHGQAQQVKALSQLDVSPTQPPSQGPWLKAKHDTHRHLKQPRRSPSLSPSLGCFSSLAFKAPLQ